MLNSAFDGVGGAGRLPILRRCGEIDQINARVYETVNNGVYSGRLRHDTGGLRGGRLVPCSRR